MNTNHESIIARSPGHSEDTGKAEASYQLAYLAHATMFGDADTDVDTDGVAVLGYN